MKDDSISSNKTAWDFLLLAQPSLENIQTDV